MHKSWLFPLFIILLQAKRKKYEEKTMDIKLNKTSKVMAEITITINKGDYEERVTKALKELRKRASIPGFRPGQAPIGMLKKRFGDGVTAEEVNKLLEEKLRGYVRENGLQVLGDPLPNEEKQQPVDFATMDEMDFVFDVALTPEFDAHLSDKDTVDYYTIEVDDKLIDQQVQMYANRAGEYKKVEEYQPRDMVKGTMTELKEGGLTVEDVVMLPDYMKNEAEKAKFTGAKVGGELVFNPYVAYEGNQVELSSMLKISKEEAVEKTGDFRLEIKEMTRYEPAAVDQTLFDNIYGEGVVTSEKEFKERIRQELEEQFQADSEYKFTIDLHDYLVARIGNVEFPDDMLKRIMKLNAPEKEMKEIEDNYPATRDALLWHLIKDQLTEQFVVKVEVSDVRETVKRAAKAQFAQYGMANVSDDTLTAYAESVLRDKKQSEGYLERTMEAKIVQAALKTVTLNRKSIALEDFNKMLSKGNDM